MHRPCPSPAPGPPAQTDSRTTSSCGPLRARSGTSKVTLSCHCTLIQLILWRCKCVEGTNLSLRPFRIVWRLSSFPFEEDIFRIPAPLAPDPFQVIHFSTLPCLLTPIGLSLSLCRAEVTVFATGILACSDAILLICAHAPRTCQTGTLSVFHPFGWGSHIL